MPTNANFIEYETEADMQEGVIYHHTEKGAPYRTDSDGEIIYLTNNDFHWRHSLQNAMNNGDAWALSLTIIFFCSLGLLIPSEIPLVVRLIFLVSVFIVTFGIIHRFSQAKPIFMSHISNRVDLPIRTYWYTIQSGYVSRLFTFAISLFFVSIIYFYYNDLNSLWESFSLEFLSSQDDDMAVYILIWLITSTIISSVILLQIILHTAILMSFADTTESESNAHDRIMNSSVDFLLEQEMSLDKKISFLKNYNQQNFEWGIRLYFSKIKPLVAGVVPFVSVFFMSIIFVFGWLFETDTFSVLIWSTGILLFIFPYLIQDSHREFSVTTVRKIITNKCATEFAEEFRILLNEEE